MAGDYQGGHLEDAFTPTVQTGRIGRQGIVERSRLVPPEVCEGDHIVTVGDDGGDVLRSVTGSLPEHDAFGDQGPFSGSRRPLVVEIHRPMVMDPGVREQSNVDRVVGW